ncbi:hypothetical protein [Bradyrhizobium ivorense]|nr:hypothetical protein [Bradyrhizobium ivorense]MCC8936072.1 hypothetical protein [Bradyrhizobium ivorense]
MATGAMPFAMFLPRSDVREPELAGFLCRASRDGDGALSGILAATAMSDDDPALQNPELVLVRGFR